MNDYVYQTQPFAHQRKIFELSRDMEAYALLMEMGTGKSKVTIDTCAWLYNTGKIDAMLVVAPCGVHTNWTINEIPIHMPEYIQYKSAAYKSGANKKEEQCISNVLSATNHLIIVAINVEALATVKGIQFAKKFLQSFRTLLVIDESSTIKNPKAIRTKNLIKLAIHAKYRRILTGTPITQGPLDLYTQFTFLDSHILGCSSYYGFRNRYAVLKEVNLRPWDPRSKSFMKIEGYQNLEELQQIIAPHSTG